MSTKTETGSQPAPMSPEEKKLARINVDIAQKMSSNIDTQTAFQKQLFADLPQQLQQYGTFNQDQLTSGLGLIDEQGKSAYASGSSDIEKSASDAYRQIGQELAPSLGLRSTDTPILDRGNLVGAETVRQKGQLTRAITGTASSQKFDFMNQLKQQALQNRLALIGQAGQGGLGLSGLGNPVGAQQALNRGGGASTATASPNYLQLAGSLAGAGAMFLSSRKIKEVVSGVDHEKTLENIEKLPVDAWRYHPELMDEEVHIGPYAEDFKELFGVGNGKDIKLVDAIGVLMSGMKGAIAQIKELKAEINTLRGGAYG